MARVDNWHSKLTAHINARRTRKFEFGYHDCVQWVASCVYVVTGVDHAASVKGTYSSGESAYRALLKNTTAMNLKELFATKFGEPQHIAFAREGDVVYKNSNAGGFDAIVGICYGRHSFFIDEENGLTELDTLSLDGCWWVN